MNKRITKKCERLGELTVQKDSIEAEIKELREDIDAAFEVGDILEFTASKQPFTITKRYEDKAVLKDNKTIAQKIGKVEFIEIAKISKTEIEKVYGKAVAADCIDHFDTESKLVLKRIKS